MPGSVEVFGVRPLPPGRDARGRGKETCRARTRAGNAAALWEFENSGGAVQAAQRSRAAVDRRGPMVIAVRARGKSAT